MTTPKPVHWADTTAERIIRQRGDKDQYTLASGITPSGTVHFGNFREVITVDLVARALRERGKKVRFIFSWDNFDTFRKVPKNMPKSEELEKFLNQPIIDTPDPWQREDSYATHHQVNFEKQLSLVGVEVDYIYQSQKYRAGDYAKGILTALEKRAAIREILNQHRSSPLASSWWPISIYCKNCNRDNQITDLDFQEGNIFYYCGGCGHSGEEKVADSQQVKLPWRIDWPMRWAYEGVDFEPGGKDHSSQGGSFSTAKEIISTVYSQEHPLYLQYDFVSIKGRGGKMSSSSGEVVTLNDVLEIFEPEIVRWIFASYKPNVDFAISFDLDVIKTYEDFDRQERLAFGIGPGSDKKRAMAKRVYQLSQLTDTPQQLPFQPAFRHLCNILQIYDGEITKAHEFYKKDIKNSRDQRRFEERAKCALNWLDNFAPEDFKFKINTSTRQANHLQVEERQFLAELRKVIEEQWDQITEDKELHDILYATIHKTEIEPTNAFKLLYDLLINKDKGPKLAGFMRIIGSEKLLHLLPVN